MLTNGIPDIDVNAALGLWPKVRGAFFEGKPDIETLGLLLEREKVELKQIARAAPHRPQTFETEFDELLFGIDLKNDRVIWRGLSIPCPRNYLLIIAGLCRMRLDGKLRCTMPDLIAEIKQLEGVRFFDAASAVSDGRLRNLVDRPRKSHTHEGYALNPPSQTLLPIS